MKNSNHLKTLALITIFLQLVIAFGVFNPFNKIDGNTNTTTYANVGKNYALEFNDYWDLKTVNSFTDSEELSFVSQDGATSLSISIDGSGFDGGDERESISISGKDVVFNKYKDGYYTVYNAAGSDIVSNFNYLGIVLKIKDGADTHLSINQMVKLIESIENTIN